MSKGLAASLVLLLAMIGPGKAAAQSPGDQPRTPAMENDVAKIKQALLDNGPDWETTDLISSDMWGRRIKPARCV